CTEKGKRAARAKLDTKDTILRRGVNDKRLGARTAKDRVPERLKACRISPVIDANPLFVQLEDDCGLAGRHQPFLAVLQGATLPVPEAPHKGSQRQHRNV